jgi:hypothetical protein
MGYFGEAALENEPSSFPKKQARAGVCISS